ncbi:hypothetical protein [Pseudarthrobacter sp. ATCC 49987]|uniref:hypothetical protein n=1 Tax=Pseudarthrobacter sp. ATCC 49987 TaxID=2698204 RepID=UPI001371781B|nr:hypothetical protein [Pseudarthrobacter sp. ATCC 49987]
MRAPSARVGKNRRRVHVYAPLLVLGALLMTAAFPTFNSAYLVGVLFLTAGAAGFVLETGTQQ